MATNDSLKTTGLSASVHSNIMQKIIKEKLVTHLTDNDLLLPAQFGFTKKEDPVNYNSSKGGQHGPISKWGYTALPGAKMGPYCPPWRAVWPHPPAWSKEGKGG